MDPRFGDRIAFPRMRHLQLPYRPDDQQEQALADALRGETPYLLILRRLSEAPRGRFPPVWQPAVLIRHPYLRAVTRAGWLLRTDAERHIAKGDQRAAVKSLLAILNLGRAIGDEPGKLAQSCRMTCRGHCVYVLEWVLCQFQLKEADLGRIQKALEDEE